MVHITATMLSCSALARLFLCPHGRQYSCPQLKRGSGFILRYYSSKEITPATKTPDFLLQNIRSSTDAKGLLHLVGNHHSIMNNLHVISALKGLFDLQKSVNSSLSKTELVSSLEFKNFCKRLKSQVRTIELNDTIDALKIISYMGVPSKSLICQSLLQMVRHRVNDLSLHQIVFLDFIMRDFSKSPLVDALKIALPLVFEAQLKIKMDVQNAAHFTEMLHYVSRKARISDASVDPIVEALERHDGNMDIKFAKSIIRSLCEPRMTSPLYRHLMFQCMDRVVSNKEQFTSDEIKGLLDVALRKIQKQPLLYHEVFVDSCLEHVMSQVCDFNHGTYLLRNLTRVGHVCLKFIDYLSQKLAEDPKVLQDCKMSVYLSFVSGIANADYTPQHWDKCVEQAIEFNQVLDHKNKVELPWIRLALDLVALGIYRQDLIEHIFQEEFLEKFLSREYNKLDYLQLLLLYQAIVTLFLDYKGTFPAPHILETAMKYNRENVEDSPLKGCLEHALGGPSYVQTRLYTKLGHIIDHAVVMRKGGYPVAMNQNIEEGTGSRAYIEDLVVPSDSQIILVLCIPENSYSINCQRVRTFASLTIRSLEALGYAVVPVSLRLWSDFPDHEKLPYLMQNLKENCILLESKQLSSAA